MLSIAIIDIIGLTYDGSTLSKRGLGGSESAVILMSKELAASGFKVTVFNNCIDKEAAEGIYNNVNYIDISKLDQNNDYKFDIVISSRTVIPFVPKEVWSQFAQYSPERYEKITNNSSFRVVWMHDTFCNGDQLIEPLLVSGRINELFTLSDFHTSYVTNADHGGRRMFEVLKHKIFQTRNGVVNYKTEVDISAKDPYLCVYNASVTKGMIPLVTKIWPRIKQVVPQAKLKVIGGYYRFRENAEPDWQELEWRKLVADPYYKSLDIEFTGIIKQSEIANILANASYTLHPGAFPETFGISSLESLMYNTPLVACRFGALEETAVDAASYLLDYPIQPNGLFPNINPTVQENKYTELILKAMQDKYLHQQKMYACNLVKNISGWDSIALQWKQHFYKIFGIFLPVEEFRKVSILNNRIRKVFGRRFSNMEENYFPSSKPEQKLLIITPVYNSENYIGRCIDSVISQDYNNWKMIIIDDASTDNTLQVINNYRSHPNITILSNEKNMGAVFNQIRSIKEFSSDEDIIMLLDGDDSLVNDNQIFSFYNNLYDNNTEFTYGSCWSMVDGIPLVAQPYPEEVKKNKTYREHKFNWNMPYTHLRTFKARLINSADTSNFMDETNNWYRAGGDCSVFYTALENADPNKVKVVSDIVYNYNDINPLNDYKINGEEQTKNANRILRMKSSTKIVPKTNENNLFSIVVPTMWKCSDFETFLQVLVTEPLVGEIIIINNDVPKTFSNIPESSKIKLHNFDRNIYVNPAWNYGIAKAKYNNICIMNDDILFDTDVFSKVLPFIKSENGVIGLCPGETEHWNQIPITTGSIDIIKWPPGMHTFGFGSLMFIHKNNWTNIPEGLNVYYGDNFIFDLMLQLNKPNYIISNMNHFTKWAQTTSDPNIVPKEFMVKETRIYNELKYKGLNTVVLDREKTILIAIPTNMGIKPETFKAIYDLEVPKGFKTIFQYFYGYQIDQIRNLIAEWGKHYDYLFCVDSDISFPPNTLKKLLAHNKEIVGGIYIQRKHGQHTLEVYKGSRNVPFEEIVGKPIVEVDAVGFGCLLINSEVLRKMEYPHFVYKSAIHHSNTISEDVYFCSKARALGYLTYVDPSITCDHHGDYTFKVDTTIKPPKNTTWNSRLRELGESRLLPVEMIQHMQSMKVEGIEPKVIYDIGSCVLHWTTEAKKIWPNSEYVLFEAMDEVDFLYKEKGFTKYSLGVLSDKDNKVVTFYQNTEHPGGNSYYKENKEVNPAADIYFNETHKVQKVTRTIDSLIKERNYPLPDLIKIDVQGAELDIIKGASLALNSCKYLILELPSVEYNKGAPTKEEVISYLKSLGFKLVKQVTPNPIYDGDYYFIKEV